ncbi:MAG: DUF6364 family protein [Candidatus Latescibacterota bacterium]
MTNITLRVDEDAVRKARKVALEENTTLAGMIREYLRSSAAGDEGLRASEAVSTMRRSSVSAVWRRPCSSGQERIWRKGASPVRASSG